MSPLFAVPPISKHLKVGGIWVVGARRVAMVTSMVMPLDALRAPPFLFGTSSQAHQLSMSLNVANYIRQDQSRDNGLSQRTFPL